MEENNQLEQNQTQEKQVAVTEPEGQPAEEKPAAKKAVRLLDAFVLTYGTIIGSGIFISVSETFKVFSSQSIIMVMIFWLFGGVIALLGGLCYAELSLRIPESGGERAYYKEVLNIQISRTFVIIFAFIVKAMTCAAISITAGKYLLLVFQPDGNLSPAYEKITAYAIFLLAAIINYWSKTVVTKSGLVLTVLKTVALLIIVVIGFIYLASGTASEWKTPLTFDGFETLQLSTALINVLWSFEGWNTLGLIAGEMQNPVRDFPLAIGFGISSVTVFYVLAVVAYSATIGYEKMKTSETVAIFVATKVLQKAYPIIPLLVCCSAAGALNGSLFSVASLTMSAGYKGEFPKIFSLVHKRQRTPVFSVFIISLVSFIFVPFNFQSLLGYCAFYTWIFYFLSLVCLLKLKFNGPKLGGRIFQIPAFFTFPVLLVCVFVVVMCFYATPVGCSIFASIFLVLFALQYLPSRFVNFPRLKKAHDCVAEKLMVWLQLEYADEKDVS